MRARRCAPVNDFHGYRFYVTGRATQLDKTAPVSMEAGAIHRPCQTNTDSHHRVFKAILGHRFEIWPDWFFLRAQHTGRLSRHSMMAAAPRSSHFTWRNCVMFKSLQSVPVHINYKYCVRVTYGYNCQKCLQIHLQITLFHYWSVRRAGPVLLFTVCVLLLLYAKYIQRCGKVHRL